MTTGASDNGWRDFLPLSTVCACGLLLAISAFATVRGYYQSVDQQRFQGDATFYATRFKDDVTRHVTSLAAIRAFVSASRVVSRWEFSTFAQQILPQNPGFRAVLWVPSVTRKDRAAYEATLQKDGLYGLRIRQATSEGALANAGDRAAYLPITYVEPFDQNENLIGVDLSDTDFYADLFRDAGRDGHVAASPPLTRTLVAGTYGPAVLLAYALSPNTAQKPDAPANHATPQGYALGVLRLESIIQEVLGPSAPIQAAIAYQESVSQGPLLVMPDGKETAQRPDRWFQNAAFHQMIPFDIADRHYLLALRSVGNTSAVTSFYVPAGASLLVLTLTALLAQNMTSVMMRKRFVERAVVSRTAQLRAANETLRGEVEQRRQAEAELRVARDKAESASRSKSAFMANMSHELRTPLNAIIGFSSILAETQSGADLRHGEYAGEILVSGRHLLDLINDILDLTQMETMSKDDGLVYLGDCVIATVNQAQAAAQAAGVTLRVSLPEHLPALMGDSRRITKALSHLISNAVKFTHQGGAAAVVIQRNNDGALALEVADTGIGMPSEARDRLREAFSQYDGRLGRKYEGIGLGLTYVGKVAEMHDATLEIVSEQGKGTRVRMVFQSHRVVKELEVA